MVWLLRAKVLIMPGISQLTNGKFVATFISLYSGEPVRINVRHAECGLEDWCFSVCSMSSARIIYLFMSEKPYEGQLVSVQQKCFGNHNKKKKERQRWRTKCKDPTSRTVPLLKIWSINMRVAWWSHRTVPNTWSTPECKLRDYFAALFRGLPARLRHIQLVL